MPILPVTTAAKFVDFISSKMIPRIERNIDDITDRQSESFRRARAQHSIRSLIGMVSLCLCEPIRVFCFVVDCMKLH